MAHTHSPIRRNWLATQNPRIPVSRYKRGPWTPPPLGMFLDSHPRARICQHHPRIVLVLGGRGTRCVAEVASELAECREVLAEKLSFELAFDPGADVLAVLVARSIDRPPSGGLAVVDYKTGRLAFRLSEVGAAGSRSGSGRSTRSRPPPHLLTHPGPAPPSPLASRR